MGSSSSKVHSKNDFELVIRISKELERLLEVEFGAEGKGLHEKITTANGLSQPLRKRMRYLATIRNKLVHEWGFDEIPDRDAFIKNFESSKNELEGILQKRKGGKSGGTSCTIC
mmetsp:Transcript_7644/g.11574  ORF Transcript_7644/g.11574 Transcript_7644/m.11574 type:complete len:114 (+) Transcript_7644:108-449(+)